MTTAIVANEYRSNIGPDFFLADAYDPEYLDIVLLEDEEGERAALQALNARMAEWFGIG